VTPSLTAALLTPDNFSTIRRTAACIASQSIAEEIELLVLTPEPARLEPDESIISRFHSLKVVKADLSHGSGPVRAAAVREATAPVIVFGEDHCYPQSGWAEALVRAHQGNRAAVGPVVTNANPGSLVSWADLLKGYGPWLAPGQSMERDHLPGHNSSYKREPLLAFGSELDDLMEAESALQWKLRDRGYALYQESTALVAHTNFEDWLVVVPVTYHAGRVFASTRALDWPFHKRFAFTAASPLIPLVRLWRHLRQAVDARYPMGLIIRVAPVLVLLLIIDAAGQAVGTVAGAGTSRGFLVNWDFHRNVPREPAISASR
jgi:hypothetical protein